MAIGHEDWRRTTEVAPFEGNYSATGTYTGSCTGSATTTVLNSSGIKGSVLGATVVLSGAGAQTAQVVIQGDASTGGGMTLVPQTYYADLGSMVTDGDHFGIKKYDTVNNVYVVWCKVPITFNNRLLIQIVHTANCTYRIRIHLTQV
jgi:hypothetical protein